MVSQLCLEVPGLRRHAETRMSHLLDTDSSRLSVIVHRLKGDR